ncbi:hypothetical protein Tco_1236844 [Tanacetum coccineum]
MTHGLKNKCCWFKLKQVGKFYMRRNLHFWQIREFQKLKPHRRLLLTMLLIKLMIWMHMTLIVIELNTAKVALMANLSYYGLDALAEVHNPDNVDNNIISQDSSAQSVEIDRLKQTLSEHLKEKESLIQTITLLKNDFKKEESMNIDREIALEKRINQLDNIVFKRDQSAQTIHMLTKPQFFYDHTTKRAFGFQNPFYLKKAQQLEPKLYDGNVIKNTSTIVIPDFEETLMLAEESYPNPSCRPTKVEVLNELPKVSMVNTSLKKLKHHLVGFDVVVKERTTATAITKGSWGFEHTKACFRDEIIPFVKALKDLFNTFDQYLIDELFEEIFQRDNSVSNKSAPSFDQLFELNELKSQSQEKDTVIKKLKEIIKSLSGKMNEDKIKKDLEEIETINIELDHRVSKLIAENEHLKQAYKQLYDSIKPARIRSKEQCDDLINQVNLKSVEISDLNASLQEKVLVITALKDDLRKLKGKALVDNVVTKHTIDLEMLKIDMEPITPKFLNKKTARSGYIKHTQEEVIVLRDLVEHVKVNYPLDHSLESSCRKVKSSLKNKDRVVAPKGTANVQHSKLNANSELKCVKCNGCMLSDNHDLCVLDFINNVNACVRSKSVKKSLKRRVWKPTGKVFTNIRYIWRPTSRTFTLVRNACPLTRITTTTGVPLRKPTDLENETPKPVVTLVYSRKPRKSKTNVPVSKSKVKCLRSKDEAPYFIIKFLKMILVRLKTPVRRIGTGNGTEFVNQTLREYYEKVDFDELTAMDSEHRSLGPTLHEMTPTTISSELVPNPPPSILYVPPSRTNWDLLFQPLFDEILNPSSSFDCPAPKVIALIAEVVAPELVHQPVHLPQCCTHDNDLFFGIPIPENDSEASSSSDVIPPIVHTAAPNSKHVTK